MVQLIQCVSTPVTEKELWCCDSKAPGLDDIFNRALERAGKTRTADFANTFEAGLKEGIFSAQWKKQKLVLLFHSNNFLRDPASYRSNCLLDTTGEDDGDSNLQETTPHR